jgi:hypothetical protein
MLPIFERWLIQDGMAVVQPDAVSEELASLVQAEEDAAFVRPDEVAELVKTWPTYQGRHIGSDEVRAWYEQVEGFRNQRLLFRLLQGLRAISESELRNKCRMAYSLIRVQLNEFVIRSQADRRNDVLVTCLDEHGKSGEYIASLFAEENRINVSNICSSEQIAARLEVAAASAKPISAVIVVDDIAATGRTLSDSLAKFAIENRDAFEKSSAKLLCCALFATRGAAERILARLKALELGNVDFRAGEIIGSAASAFAQESGLWINGDERERAKALATDLGARIYKSQPLGYGGMGLLMVFPTTVPNNSLPILHSRSKVGQNRWVPLFPRPTN